MPVEFLNYCPNAASLSTCDDVRKAWISVFGGQIEELEITSNSCSPITKYCINLRVLKLHMVWLDFGLSYMWKSIGKRLERSDSKTREHSEQRILAIFKHIAESSDMLIYLRTSWGTATSITWPKPTYRQL